MGKLEDYVFSSVSASIQSLAEHAYTELKRYEGGSGEPWVLPQQVHNLEQRTYSIDPGSGVSTGVLFSQLLGATQRWRKSRGGPHLEDALRVLQEGADNLAGATAEVLLLLLKAAPEKEREAVAERLIKGRLIPWPQWMQPRNRPGEPISLATPPPWNAASAAAGILLVALPDTGGIRSYQWPNPDDVPDGDLADWFMSIGQLGEVGKVWPGGLWFAPDALSSAKKVAWGRAGGDKVGLQLKPSLRVPLSALAHVCRALREVRSEREDEEVRDRVSRRPSPACFKAPLEAMTPIRERSVSSIGNGVFEITSAGGPKRFSVAGAPMAPVLTQIAEDLPDLLRHVTVQKWWRWLITSAWKQWVEGVPDSSWIRIEGGYGTVAQLVDAPEKRAGTIIKRASEQLQRIQWEIPELEINGQGFFTLDYRRGGGRRKGYVRYALAPILCPGGGDHLNSPELSARQARRLIPVLAAPPTVGSTDTWGAQLALQDLILLHLRSEAEEYHRQGGLPIPWETLAEQAGVPARLLPDLRRAWIRETETEPGWLTSDGDRLRIANHGAHQLISDGGLKQIKGREKSRRRKSR